MKIITNPYEFTECEECTHHKITDRLCRQCKHYPYLDDNFYNKIYQKMFGGKKS